MIRKTLIASMFLIPIAFGAMPALAESSEDCTDAPKAQWLSEDAAKAKATKDGYDVRDIKVEGSCFELYAIDKEGKRVEARMNPVSGEIVGNEEGDE
jgi:hypothetical protein